MNNEYIVAIPARYKSSRLPGKPLKLINGKAMINHVWDLCIKAVGRKNVIVLTDDIRIKKHCIKHKISFFMTSKSCKTGTDRIYQFAKKNFYKYYINVQGDEPTINPKDIIKVINTKKKFPNHVICGYDKVHNFENPKSTNLPKVVVNSKGELIYISRALVPGAKNRNQNINYYKQVFIYAFNKKQLKKFYSAKKKSPTESIEDIEILRFFDLDEKIKMVKLNSNSVAVDEIKDVKKAEKLIKENN